VCGAVQLDSAHPVKDRISVVLVDDHTLVRSGIRRLLEDDHGLRVVGEAGDGDDAMRVVRDVRPDVVVLDYAMPGTSALAVIRRMLDGQPGLAIVVVSIHDPMPIVQMVLAAGATGYLLKGSPGAHLIDAIKRVAAGETVLDAAMPWASVLASPRSHALSARQLEVLQLLCEGLSNQLIAARLGLSPNTVAVHRAGIMKRLGTHSVTQLVGYAIRHRLVIVT
jgi:DNA-binding NarL/FixJ family response regulator